MLLTGLQVLLAGYIISDCFIDSLEVVPERAAITYTNPKYVVDAHVSVRRYSRRSPYYLNLEGKNLQTWTNNVSGHKNLPNMTLASVPAVDHLPYKWPFEKGKVVALVQTNPGKQLIAEGYAVGTFKESNKSSK